MSIPRARAASPTTATGTLNIPPEGTGTPKTAEAVSERLKGLPPVGRELSKDPAAIAYVQKRLNVHGIKIDVDGKPGPKLDAAILAFQKQQNFPRNLQTGICAQKTHAVLAGSPSDPTPAAVVPGPGFHMLLQTPELKAHLEKSQFSPEHPDYSAISGNMLRADGVINHPIMDIADQLGAEHGLTKTSGRRTAEHNRQVGGVSNSAHVHGRGGDWSGDAGAQRRFAEAMKAELQRRGLSGDVINEGDHIHVEVDETPELLAGMNVKRDIPV